MQFFQNANEAFAYRYNDDLRNEENREYSRKKCTMPVPSSGSSGE